MKKKNFFAIICAVMLVFSLAFVGCNGNSDKKDNGSNDDSGWTAPY